MKNVVIFLEPKLFKYVITIPFLLLWKRLWILENLEVDMIQCMDKLD